MVTISGKAIGRKKPLFADWSIPFPPDLPQGEGMTLRDLITRIVRTEVEAFQQRQQDRHLLRALTANDIAQGVAKGKIDMGGRDLKQEVNEDAALAAALQAFEDGLYLVVVDGAEQRELDRQVYLQAESRITFLRLTMLAGG